MDYENRVAELEKENKYLRAMLEKQTQAKAVTLCAVFFSSFAAASLVIYFFFDYFKNNDGVFMIELVIRALTTGIGLLLWSFIQRVLFGDPMKEYNDAFYPQVDKKKESVMLFLLVASIYAFQLIGYFIFSK